MRDSALGLDSERRQTDLPQVIGLLSACSRIGHTCPHCRSRSRFGFGALCLRSRAAPESRTDSNASATWTLFPELGRPGVEAAAAHCGPSLLQGGSAIPPYRA